ncbi:hypothetical protein TNCV_1935361 [Trichonephila clavipes]|nr:hypothetical protein TNCV_1935361 [Trichonephila clavipes]
MYAPDHYFGMRSRTSLPTPSYFELQGNFPLTPPLIVQSSKNSSTFSNPGKKSSGETLNPDPTPTSGFEKLRCPWEKPVERYCDSSPPPPGEVISSSTRPKFVGERKQRQLRKTTVEGDILSSTSGYRVSESTDGSLFPVNHFPHFVLLPVAARHSRIVRPL